MKNLLLALSLLALGACALSPEASVVTDDLLIQREVFAAERESAEDELSDAVASGDEARADLASARISLAVARRDAVDAEIAAVRDDDRKDQATEWGGIAAALLAAAGGAGFLGGKTGPSRSASAVSKVKDELAAATLVIDTLAASNSSLSDEAKELQKDVSVLKAFMDGLQQTPPKEA